MVDNSVIDALQSEKLKYKSSLDIEEDINFGVEVEFVNKKLKEVSELFKENSLDHWEVKEDTSVTDYENFSGGEIASPILDNTSNSWNKLKEALYLLRNNNAGVDSKCSTHLHFSSTLLESNYDNWLNFFKLWMVYEMTVFKFSVGAWENIRSNVKFYAKPLYREFYNTLQYDLDQREFSVLDLIETYTYEKNSSLNLNNVKGFDFENGNTIEFRTMNPTLNEEIVQNEVNFFYHFMKYAKSKNFDEEFIDYKIKKLNTKISYLYALKKNYDKDALELADLIYSKDSDKLDFFLQYFGINLPDDGIIRKKSKNL